MRVLITHERYLPDFGGGGEHVVASTATNLAKRGIDVEVLTTGDSRITSYGSIRTIRLPIPRHLMNLAAAQIAQRAREADIIHTFNYHACLPSLLAGSWLRKPVVCTCLALFGDAWTEMRGLVLGTLLRQWERFLLTRSWSKLLFLSEYSRDAGMAMGISPERSSIAMPGIGVLAAEPSWPRQDVVLFAGKFEVRKGVYDVLQTARSLPHIKFRMVGWGPERDRMIASAPPNVKISGETGPEYQKILSRARIFVLPTLAETFGIALVEAMKSGCAVISTIPLEFAGARVRAGDRESLTGEIARLWTSREECDRLGRRNIELAAGYTWSRYTDVLLDTYRTVISEPILISAGGSLTCR